MRSLWLFRIEGTKNSLRWDHWIIINNFLEQYHANPSYIEHDDMAVHVEATKWKRGGAVLDFAPGLSSCNCKWRLISIFRKLVSFSNISALTYPCIPNKITILFWYCAWRCRNGLTTGRYHYHCQYIFYRFNRSTIFSPQMQRVSSSQYPFLGEPRLANKKTH